MQIERVHTAESSPAGLKKARARQRGAFGAARKGAYVKSSKGKLLVRLAKPTTGLAALTGALAKLSAFQGSPTKITFGRKSAAHMVYGDLRAVVEDTSRASRRTLANFAALNYADLDRAGTADSERATERP